MRQNLNNNCGELTQVEVEDGRKGIDSATYNKPSCNWTPKGTEKTCSSEDGYAVYKRNTACLHTGGAVWLDKAILARKSHERNPTIYWLCDVSSNAILVDRTGHFLNIQNSVLLQCTQLFAGLRH